MPETRIERIETTDIANAKPDFQVASVVPEGIDAGMKETIWMDPDFYDRMGYYKKIPELKSKIDTYANWTIGKGFTSDDPQVELDLSVIRGNGFDTFNSILFNLIIQMKVGGNAYAEIIRDTQDKIVNLKPLDPGTMRHIINRKGQIVRFEQVMKIGSAGQKIIKFDVEEIFYLANDRVADEIKGTSIIEAIKDLLDSRNEALKDMRVLMHRNLVPVRIWEGDTDNINRLEELKKKLNEAVKTSENIIVPKGTLQHVKDAGIAPNATLNPLPYIEQLSRYISQATKVPDIVNGSSTNLTEAASKIEYLAWQQTIEKEQRFLEEQTLAQLNLDIKLTFPARLDNEALSDNPRPEDQAGQQVQPPEIQQGERAVEPNDQVVEEEGRT